MSGGFIVPPPPPPPPAPVTPEAMSPGDDKPRPPVPEPRRPAGSETADLVGLGARRCQAPGGGPSQEGQAGGARPTAGGGGVPAAGRRLLLLPLVRQPLVGDAHRCPTRDGGGGRSGPPRRHILPGAEIESFRSANGRLPDTLEEMGSAPAEMSYQRIDARSYQLVGQRQGVTLTFNSEQAITQFVGTPCRDSESDRGDDETGPCARADRSGSSGSGSTSPDGVHPGRARARGREHPGGTGHPQLPGSGHAGAGAGCGSAGADRCGGGRRPELHRRQQPVAGRVGRRRDPARPQQTSCRRASASPARNSSSIGRTGVG